MTRRSQRPVTTSTSSISGICTSSSSAMVIAHPTIAEALSDAVADALGRDGGRRGPAAGLVTRS